jgi:hypothetical protein
VFGIGDMPVGSIERTCSLGFEYFAFALTVFPWSIALKKALNIKRKDILKIWLNDSQIIMEKTKSRNEQKVKLPLKE